MFVYAGKARVEKNLYVGKIFSGKGIHRLFALEEWFFALLHAFPQRLVH